MGVSFEDDAFRELAEWASADKKKFDKITALVEDIHRHGPMKGMGKPERLKHRPAFSRRIDQEHRLVYELDDKGNVHIVSCKGHYDE